MKLAQIKNYSVVLACALTTACATQTGWRPTVDMRNNPNAHRLNQDMIECQQLAREAAGGTGQQTLIGAGVGGLVGGAGGAAIGAVTGGDAGRGAAIGATVGALGGAAKQGMEAEQRYQRAYIDCLRDRGHPVIR